jgi:uncharacterized protein (DUF1800 family)
MLRLILAGLLVAWAAAAQAAGMGTADARHLLRRTGFDAPPAEVARFAQLTHEQAVDRILAGTHQEARTPLPPEVLEWTDPRTLRGMSPEERKAFQQDLRRRVLALKGWWLDEMVTTDSPLTERMTLFWHNHFTSSIQKVRSPALMARQNELLRRYALGNFGALLHAVAKDPAMLLYLDGVRNRKSHPNENFAREVMELFTLGVGHYSESDVREAARAYTGWSVDPADGRYRWRPFMHDRGMKTVLGQSGDFDGDQVLDILLAQPAAAEFVAAKLWREFVSPQPDARELEHIAADFRASGYEIRVALRELLLSDAFWAPANRDSLVKSPVDLVVGTVRRYGIRYDDPRPLVFALHQLGEDLFAPPDVRGWPGGEEWITTQTLLARKQFLARVFRGEQARMMSPAAMAARVRYRPEDEAALEAVRARVLAPEYELK